MSTATGIFVVSLFVQCTILWSYVGFVSASPCSRVPQGTGAGKSVPSGNFGIRISSASTFYQPGRDYTIFLERKNLLRNRESSRPKFMGFFLAIERESTVASEYAEEFNPAIHGKLLIDDSYQSLVRLGCGNLATHYLDTPKEEIQVNWTAPEPGAGNLSIRATVIENRDIWYMDGIFLTIDLQEDVDSQADYLSNVLEQCDACDEAKYELSFEGLWSKHTHPKNFPSNQFGARFGDIIGATHTVGSHFWSSGDKATDGFRTVAESGVTEQLELELKNMSSNIRTIIKARGLAHPNITTKTLAVFRVDNENHLVSFVSTLLPSPDWFVGVSAMELCLPEGKWVETKVLDLYPWDAGTNDGTTYEDKRPSSGERREYIRRITSEWPASKDSPFYDENGTKMKPLARLTLSRQRLYKKNCPDGESDNESIFNDPECDEAVSYSSWGPCQPSCKETADQRGTQMRNLRYKSPDAEQLCERKYYDRRRDCEIQSFCVGTQTQDGQDNNMPPPQQPDDDQYQTTTPAQCDGTYKKRVESDCVGTCGIGEKNLTQRSTNPYCEDLVETVPCNLAPCKNAELCTDLLDAQNCKRADYDPANPPSATNLIYYNSSLCTCMVFTTYCVKEEGKNIFDTFTECTDACQIGPERCTTRFPTKKKY